MATISITSTTEQDAAVQRRVTIHNTATGGSETAVQYARRHMLAMLERWVVDDAATALAGAKDRWERSSEAQRTSALNQLAP